MCQCWRTNTQLAAFLAALILAGLICFQLLLVAGLPLGHFAWGGAHQILPRQLRFASLAATVVYVLAAALVLEAANVTDFVPIAEPVRTAVWVLAGLFGVGVLMNAISRSKPERLMALVALALSALCVVVALG